LLSDLSKKGILIVDIYPCHGISIQSSQRPKFLKIFYPSYSKRKLEIIDNEIKRMKNGINPVYSNKVCCSSEILQAGLNKSNKDLNDITKEILRLTSDSLEFDKINQPITANKHKQGVIAS
jgi:hypothetical protein